MNPRTLTPLVGRPQDVTASPLFSRWTDPTSGVASFVLAQRVAPVQQSFYFVNPGFSSNGRYLWFYCAFPPSGDAYAGRLLGVTDLQAGDVRCFPDTQFSDASPSINTATGEAYWFTGLELWKRSPAADQPAVLVNTFLADIAKNRRPLRVATHLTRSADGRRFNIDAQLGNEWIVGDIGVNAADPLRVWQTFDRCYNHVQFSPTDPDLLLIAQDFWYDASTGQKGDSVDRLWLLRRGETAQPIYPNTPSAMRGHEWWQADGEHVWFVHYGLGTRRVNINTGKDETIWPGSFQHSHCDKTGTYVVSDMSNGSDGWRIAFFNRTTGRAVNIVTFMVKPPAAQAKYHVHPHPHFCCDDRYICYTTIVHGRVDMAVVEVAQLIQQTQ